MCNLECLICMYLENRRKNQRRKTLPSSAGGKGSIPGQGGTISSKHQNMKQKQDGNKSNKDFKNGSHQKKKKSKK